MKKLNVRLSPLVGALTASALLVAGSAGASGTASAPASANIIVPLSIEAVDNGGLRFGDLVPGTGGAVTIDAATGTRTADSGIILSGGDVGGAAQFTVEGDADATFNIQLDETVTLTGPDDAEMTATLDHDLSETGNALTGSAATLNVGGVLTVSEAQAQGAYTGNFQVTVAYD